MSENIPFDHFIVPDEPAEKTQKRIRGGQPGNLNALKHGLYIQKGTVYNLTPVERASLCDFNDLIIHYKKYMEHLFELGIKSKDLAEVNVTLRSLALAGMALTRLVHTQVNNSYANVSEEWGGGKLQDTSFKRMYHGILKTMSTYMDVSDLEAALDEKIS